MAKKTAKKKVGTKETKAAAPELAARLSAGLPSIAEAERSAFLGLASDEECEALGLRTRGENVEREALAWASVIVKVLARPELHVRYSKARLAFFLECIDALSNARRAQAASQGTVKTSRAVLEKAIAQADPLREDLAVALQQIAGEDAVEKVSVQTAKGSKGRDPLALADSIERLATLAESWLGKGDARSKALVAGANLRAGDVTLARAAALQLRIAAGDGTVSGKLVVRDAPPVNRAEGRVLFEMKTAMRAFDAAHALDGNVPRLSPGAGTRAVLAPHPRTTAKAPKPPATTAPS
jgi:hypothetical protein